MFITAQEKIEVRFIFTLVLPFYLQLPDAQYNCRLGKNEYAIITKAYQESIAPDKNDQRGRSIFFKPATGELTQVDPDVYVPGALLQYTKISVAYFRRIKEDKLSSIQPPNEEITKIHQYLNHFLDMYRFLARDLNVRPLTIRELHQVRAKHALNFRIGFQSKEMMGVMFDDEDPIKIGKAKVIDESIQDQMRQRLVEGQAPEITQLLLLDAEGAFATGNYRIAIIDANAALDITVEKKATEILFRQGKSQDQIQKDFERMTTKPIVTDVLKTRLSVDPTENEHWVKWDSKHRGLRNHVVHDGYKPVKEEAKESLIVIQKLVNFFEQSTVKERQSVPNS